MSRSISYQQLAELLIEAARLIAARDLNETPADDRQESVPDRFVWLKPNWHARSGCLYLGHTVVKKFRHRAPNQERLLAAFQEDDWAERIDDPLPGTPGIDPKQRLHETIAALNKCQECTALRFVGDGTGRGVRWKFSSGLITQVPSRHFGST